MTASTADGNATSFSAHSHSDSATATLAMRRDAMSVLAATATDAIAAHVAAIAAPEHVCCRTPESGLVMLRGRIGGDGNAFNLGEATVSRAAVRLASGETGFGYVLGRDGEKARLVALCDALIQAPSYAGAVRDAVIEPLRRARDAERQRTREQAAATRVDFFTLVRGED